MSESSSAYLRAHMDGHDEGYSKGFAAGIDAAREMISEQLESRAQRYLNGAERLKVRRQHYHDALMWAAHRIREQAAVVTAIKVYRELFEETGSPGAAYPRARRGPIPG